MPSGGGADASLSSLASLMGGDDADATARLKQAIAAMQGEGGASMGDLMKGMADGENSMAKMMQARLPRRRVSGPPAATSTPLFSARAAATSPVAGPRRRKPRDARDAAGPGQDPGEDGRAPAAARLARRAGNLSEHNEGDAVGAPPCELAGGRRRPLLASSAPRPRRC